MSDRRGRTQIRPGSALRVWRSLFVATALIASATVAYLPGYPGAVSAETFVGPDSTQPAVATEQPTEAPTPESSAPPDSEPTTTPTTDPSPSPSTEPSVLPTATATPDASFDPSPAPSPTPTSSPGGSAPLTLGITADRPASDDGIVRVEPHGTLVLTATVVANSSASGVTLFVSVPDGWTVTESGGGAAADGGLALSWTLDPLEPDVQVARHFSVRAPELDTSAPAEPVTFAVRAEQVDGESSTQQDGPSLLVLVASPVSIAHVTAARVPGPGIEPHYLNPDEPLLAEPRYEVFRLRFEVVNSGLTDYHWAPTLEWTTPPDGRYAALPAGASVAGVPFFAAPEWMRTLDGGTVIGPSMVGSLGPPPLARSMGANPLPDIIIPAESTFLVEFSVQATADADYLAEYWLRLTDAGTPIPNAPSAKVTLEALSPVVLSPGQRDGVPADESAPGSKMLGPFKLGSTTTGFHAPAYDLSSDACAACHRAHTASGTMITAAPSDLALCASCHNGSSAPDVLSAYAGVPANDAATRSYYQHDPSADDAAYATRPECSECHNPHDSSSTRGAPSASGWSPSGLTAAAPAVAASWSGGLSYTLVARPTLEYQLCLKCHSGYSQLPSNSGQPPSRFILDKGTELNPSNASYHPISAPGKNGTDAMVASLAGTSPYKLWNFAITDTVRCLNCHADARVVPKPPVPPATTGPTLTADATLSIHASPERGILIASYRDRVLKGPNDTYNAVDFALCFVCHSEAPFKDTSGAPRDDTNFRYHGLHVSGDALLNHGSTGTDIDRPSDGGGLAVCAECHFRIHSSAYPINGQAAGPRLVDYAPNVSGGLTPSSWSPRIGTTAGTCALECHGWTHSRQY